MQAVSRILAIDVGTKRIGLAMTDEMRIIASPFEVVPNDENFWDYLKKIVPFYSVQCFVLGKPVHDGENSFLPFVVSFGCRLAREFSFPIYWQDETLSSKETRLHLIASGKRGKKLKQNIDRYAAQAILASFLEVYEKNRGELFRPDKELL